MDDNKIMILTYHGSKGLDFDNVLIPFTDNSMRPEKIDELCLVALTRCKKNLTVYYDGRPTTEWNRFLNV